MITTTLANQILKYFFAQITNVAFNAGGQCYLGLSMGEPNADGSNFNEPDPETTGYKRRQICIQEAMIYTNLMTVPEDGYIENKEEITFNEALIDYPEQVTHFGIFHKPSGNDKPLYVHPLTTSTPDENGDYQPQPVSVSKGEVLIFKQGAFSLNFSKD